MKIKNLCSYAPKSRIKAGEAVENAKYLFFTSSADENKRYTDFQFDKEAIIMGTGGNATLHYYNGKFSVSTDCLVLFPNSKIKCKYLYYFFKSHMSVLEAGFKGAGLKHTNKKYIEEINVSKVPDLSTQEKIVSHLDTITENIEKLNRELELFDSLTKARFVEMFGDKKYDSVPLLDTIKTGAGLSYGIVVPGDDVEDGIPMVRPSDFNDGTLDLSNVYKVAKDIERKYSKTRLIGDEILFQVIGQPGQVMLATEECNGMNVTRNLAVVRPNHEIINRIYLKHFIENEDSQQILLKNTKQSTLKQLPLNLLKQLPVQLPPIELQKEFESFVQQVDKSRFDIKKIIIELEREVVYD